MYAVTFMPSATLYEKPHIHGPTHIICRPGHSWLT